MKLLLAISLCVAACCAGWSIIETHDNSLLSAKLAASKASFESDEAKLQTLQDNADDLQSRMTYLQGALTNALVKLARVQTDRDGYKQRVESLEAFKAQQDQLEANSPEALKAKKAEADRKYWANYYATAARQQAVQSVQIKEQSERDAEQAIADEAARREQLKEQQAAQVIENDRIRAQAAAAIGRAAVISAQNGN